MTLDDLKLQIETMLGTTEKDFKLGEQRILAVRKHNVLSFTNIHLFLYRLDVR